VVESVPTANIFCACFATCLVCGQLASVMANVRQVHVTCPSTTVLFDDDRPHRLDGGDVARGRSR
jgi:hypothetical protein